MMKLFDEAANLTREQFEKILAVLQKEPREPAPPSAQSIRAVDLQERANRHAEFEARRKELEAHIEAAGREEVFAHARALGWTGGAPMWVWHAIASEVQSRKLAQSGLKSPQSA